MSENESEKAIIQFSEITKCDEAFAHSILQDVDYNLNEALKKYYADQDENKKNVTKQSNNMDYNSLPEELTFFTWNIDGIDTNNLKKRFKAVLHVIAKNNPEIIFLQEVVPDVMTMLMDLMSKMYHIFISNPNFPYFCVTLLSKNIQIINEESIPFENTAMSRGMLVIEAQWKNLKLNLINSHLESMLEYSKERKNQFLKCISKLELMKSKSNNSKTISIFAGDLNLRDAEVFELPSDIKDAWNEGGSKTEEKFTWDMRRNDNKQAGGARLRFDRVYYSAPYRKVDFFLTGTQRIKGIHCFPSDHFGIVCRFHNLPKNQLS